MCVCVCVLMSKGVFDSLPVLGLALERGKKCKWGRWRGERGMDRKSIKKKMKGE